MVVGDGVLVRQVVPMCRSRGPRAAAVDGSASKARSTERFFVLAWEADYPAARQD